MPFFASSPALVDYLYCNSYLFAFLTPDRLRSRCLVAGQAPHATQSVVTGSSTWLIGQCEFDFPG
jgi:hypothetical protein